MYPVDCHSNLIRTCTLDFDDLLRNLCMTYLSECLIIMKKRSPTLYCATLTCVSVDKLVASGFSSFTPGDRYDYVPLAFHSDLDGLQQQHHHSYSGPDFTSLFIPAPGWLSLLPVCLYDVTRSKCLILT